MIRKSSLQFRIFLYMILMVVVAFFVISVVTIIEYKERARKYHQDRLIYKEEQIKTQIQYVLSQSSEIVSEENLPKIFEREIFQIANMQNISFNIYNLRGEFLMSSNAFLDEKSINKCIEDNILQKIENSANKRVSRISSKSNGSYQSSYAYFYDNQFKPIGILNIPYFENDSFNEALLYKFLKNIAIVYLVWIFIAVLVSYFLSKYITKNLKSVENLLKNTNLLSKNAKIIENNSTKEIEVLVNAYNLMVEQLEQSKKELSKIEREEAWREMARKVAHEIKNPLTPMKLMVQNFERKFSPKDPEVEKKVEHLCNSLVQHIDSLSEITDAFSSFTSTQEDRKSVDVNKLIRKSIDIFEQNIEFITEQEEILAELDVNQFNRVIINLVKNAVQSVENVEKPKIKIRTWQAGEEIGLMVQDNGVGISKENMERIFEPKFTTKTKGSGIGLAIVKNVVNLHKGTIEVKSKEGEGTKFIIRIKQKE